MGTLEPNKSVDLTKCGNGDLPQRYPLKQFALLPPMLRVTTNLQQKLKTVNQTSSAVVGVMFRHDLLSQRVEICLEAGIEIVSSEINII
jgi:hypothetical protein